MHHANHNFPRLCCARLFCSGCSQEFATTQELNLHMEKHQAEITAGAAATGGIFCTTCGAQVQLNSVMEFHFETELLSNKCFT